MRHGSFAISVRRPTPPAEIDRQYPIINGVLADWRDIELSVVTDDGEQILVTDVKRISFDFNAEIPEALTVKVELYPKTLEVRLESIEVKVHVDEPADEDSP